MSDIEHRLKQNLEPLLELPDPRQRISAYHDMPYALFRYHPQDEFVLRQQVTLLETRLSQKGKRVRRISLAECLNAAMRLQRRLTEWFDVERALGTETVVETVHAVLSEGDPSLVDLARHSSQRKVTRAMTLSSSCVLARSSPCTAPSHCSSS